MNLPHTHNLFLGQGSGNEGPSLDYGDGTLFVSDINIETQWRMSRWGLFMLGYRCVGAALEPRRDLPQHQDLPRFIIAVTVILVIAVGLGAFFTHYATPTRPTDRLPVIVN